MTDTHVGSVELCALTGMSYRQLDYWVRNGVIPDGGTSAGSGTRRLFPGSIIPAVEVLVKVAKAFTSKDVGQLSVNTYAEIYENYERGWVEVAPGVRITWA